MKTNFKRIGKQSISIVLAVMMMLSTMLVGMVTSNAANNEINQQYLYVDISAYSGHTLTSISPYWQLDCNDNNTAQELLTTNADACTNVSTGIYKFDLSKSNSNSYTYFRSFSVKYDSTSTKQMNVPVDNSYNCIKFDSNGNLSWTTYSSTEPTDNTYYICGAKGLTGYDWNTDASTEKDAIAANKLEYDSATSTYSKTYTNIAKGDYEFKVRDTKNNGWFGFSDYSISSTTTDCSVSNENGNIKLSLTGTCDVTISISSDNKNMIVTTSKDVQTYTIKTETAENGTVTTSAASLAAGETFTVTAEPSDGYELDAITVTTADGKPVAATNESTHTYTMPASNVIVSATFNKKTDTEYSVTYTPPTGDGVANSSIDPTDAKLTEGTNVTVTVTVKDGYTASLAVQGAKVTTSKSGNTYKFKFLMPAQNITVAPKVTKAAEETGTMIQDLYLIYTTEDEVTPTKFTQFLNLYYDSNKQVYASFNEDTKFDTSKTYKFMISTLKGENSFRGTTNYNKDNHNVNVTTTDSNSIQVGTNEYGYTDNGVYAQYYYGLFSVKNPSQSTVSSVKINLGYYNNGKIQESATDTSYTHSYEVIPISGVEGMVQVFAKDGTIRDGYQKYADMADTVLENGADLTKYDNENKYYETAYANPGTKLKIKTTIGDDYKGTYFVKAFSINGYSYGIIDASQADKIKGVYTCEYTIPEDFEGKRIEITPIYYYIDDKDTVTFYVEGFEGEVQKMWGNTVAVHAWYANCEEEDDPNNSKFDSLTKNALGGYPGQPLVYQGGKYSMQIPKCLNGEKANYVKGITLNNYFWDNIHKQNFDDQSNTSKFNCQTYDYDDFYKLSESPDVDNIIFDFRYRTTDDNDKEGNIPNKKDLNSSTYDKSKLELLKDYSGNIVDIFGNILSEDLTADYKNKHLTVISDGYVPITSIGNYATEWSVYDVDGTYITTINCSSLINESNVDADYTDDYNKLKGYDKLPVMIAYEKSITKGEQLGTRADGRWYFSKKADTISANVQIEYGTGVNSVFNVDIFESNSNVGTVTRAQAYFTNAGSIGKTTCDGTVDGGNFSVHAETDANAKYYFLGWYLKTSDGGYSPITNESDADFPMTSNATYVARFINTPSGTLTLSHTLLGGSAYGKTFIKADIVDSNGKVINSFKETSGNIVIPSSYVNYKSEYSIKVTLRTEPYGKDTVEGFYNSEKKRYDYAVSGTGEKTYEVSTTIMELFDPSSYELKKSNIPFYSNIKSNPQEYTITYTYDTRLDKKQSYVIKDTVSGAELDEMWAQNVAAGLDNKYQLSKAFIIRKAPFVSNFRKEITWNIGEANIEGYKATVLATATTDKLKISALTAAGSWTAPAPVEYGELAKSNGDYLYKTGTDKFPEKFNYSGTTYYDFSFWAIFDNPDAAQKYSDAVAKYMSDTPDENMSERLTKLTQLDGYKNLISKSYSKKYNYVSYQDYYIVPVYAGRFAKEQIKESQVSIRLLEYTRNQWTDDTHGVNGNGIKNEGGSKTDYLYTDFALSFDKDQLLIKNNSDIKVGIAFEIVAKYDPVKDDLKSFETTPSDTTTIGDKVKAATHDGKVGTYTMEGAERSIYRYEIDNTKISEKNRIEYYLRFNNNKKAQQNVMKVYSYIYDTKKNEIYLSAPEYMNMYDIGNLTYITSGLASNDLQPATEIG